MGYHVWRWVLGVGGEVVTAVGIQVPLPHHGVGQGADVKVALRSSVSARPFEAVL